MSRVVVTGGAGFLGSHLCRALLARGDEVVAIDNLITGALRNIDDLFGHPGFTFQHHDVSNFVHVPGRVDAVMHLASPASPADFERIPIQILKVGSRGTHHTLGLAKDKGARYFLASTSEVYGDPLVHPQPETYWGNVNPIGPRGVYDEAKRFAESMTMAYHRYHGVDVRIVRIFNSILGDEQVLYDDGVTLRRETIAEVADRVGVNVDLRDVAVPAFGPDGAVAPASATALVGHPPAGRCFLVRTRYGRSVRVTGDHSVFVEGANGAPAPKPVSDLEPGEHIAIHRKVGVPERDRERISVVAALDAEGVDPWDVLVLAPGLGEVAWERRFELFGVIDAWRPRTGKVWRNQVWAVIRSCRERDAIPLAAMRKLGISIPDGAQLRPRTSGRAARLPAEVTVTDELLWFLGVLVAEGCRHDHPPKSSFVTICCDDDVLDRCSGVIQRAFGLHVVRVRASAHRAGAIFVHSTHLVRLLDHLGFNPVRRIPGWVLGLPLHRLKWFIEGYREGDGVHSGKKLDAGVRHEWSTVSGDLKDDLVVAFARFGLLPSVGRYERTLRHKTGDRRYPFWRLTLCNVSPWSPLDWDAGVTQQINARSWGDLVWAKVTAIEEIEPTPLVYDFCVPGRENFWAGGVACHNTFGPAMRPDDGRAVSNFLVQAIQGKPITVYGDGLQTRSFTYVDDEIRGFLALLDSDHVGPVNIGNPNEYTIQQLAELAIEVTGSTSEVVYEPLPVDDPTQRKPDITLARSILGWAPTVELREGLERTAAYFREVL
ncbi:MAG TPA: NAD-dependent epimerase/dehydratase family protein [Acidimicrobiales bacterium]|nr:NAD-dependent epimerase/dehydratase family protein [Acidimicrobiales bacterium]